MISQSNNDQLVVCKSKISRQIKYANKSSPLTCETSLLLSCTCVHTCPLINRKSHRKAIMNIPGNQNQSCIYFQVQCEVTRALNPFCHILPITNTNTQRLQHMNLCSVGKPETELIWEQQRLSQCFDVPPPPRTPSVQPPAACLDTKSIKSIMYGFFRCSPPFK